MADEFTVRRLPAQSVSPADVGACYRLVEFIKPLYLRTQEGWDRRTKMAELKYTPGLEYFLVKKGRTLAAFASFVPIDLDYGLYEEEPIDLALELPTSLYVWEIHVDPAYHRRGLGSRLLEELKAAATEANQKTIRLRCFTENINARRFYEKSGFLVESSNEEAMSCYLPIANNHDRNEIITTSATK